jgi:hypothetical protein
VIPESATAIIFYVSIVAIVVGLIRTVRASIERQARDPLGITIAGVGAAGLVVAVIAFVTGPKHMLPF